MYICICNGHRDRDIQQAARSGLTCAREIYRQLGKPARCGRCLDLATQLINEVHGAAQSAKEGAQAQPALVNVVETA